ncbi:MAG: haloacid dehalogenase-like hydrolase [Anaerolineae bacterium]|nr:haloacid dehalogenase-like hydrolase [Anaerolineae bacterium]NUQ03680.1 haloacid dehalogenase-like hydrolase [Anaerolineae bacterium]
MTTALRPAVFSDVEGTLISISFPRTYFEQARLMGLVPPLNIIQTGFLNLLSKPFSPKSRVGGILRYLAIMTAMRNLPMSMNPQVMDRVNPLLHQALKPKTLARIREYEGQGYPVILVSAALQQGVEMFAATLGWRGEGTRPILDGDRFTGRAEKPLTGAEKVVRVRQVAAEMGLDLARSVGFGDTVSDTAFLSILGAAYVVHPDPDLRAIAAEKGWTILEGGG